MNDQCMSATLDTCAGKVALVSKLTFPIAAADLELSFQDPEALDASPLATSIKEGLHPVLSAAGMTVDVTDITILSLQPGSLVVDYKVDVPVDAGSTTVSDAVKASAQAGMNSVSLAIPADATVSGVAQPLVVMVVQSEQFNSYTYVKTHGCTPGTGASGAACLATCGLAMDVVTDAYECKENGLLAISSLCLPPLGAAPTTETICCAATQECPAGAPTEAEPEPELEGITKEGMLDDMNPFALMAATAGVCGLCVLALLCERCCCGGGGSGGGKDDDHYDDEHGSDTSYDERTAVNWKEPGAPNTSVDYTVSAQASTPPDQKQVAEEGTPPTVPEVDAATRLEKAKRLQALLEQVNPAPASSSSPAAVVSVDGMEDARAVMRQHNQAVGGMEAARALQPRTLSNWAKAQPDDQAGKAEGDEEDGLAAVDGAHLREVGEKAEMSWNKLKTGAEAASFAGASQENKAALVSSWMKNSAAPRPGTPPRTPATPRRQVTGTFAEGPLGIKFGKQRVRPGGDAAEWQAVCVANILPGTQAALINGLKPGMAILSVNGKEVMGLPPREVMRELTSSARPVDVLFGWPADAASAGAARPALP